MALAPRGQSELGVSKVVFQERVGHVVQDVGGIETQIEVAPLADPENPARRRIQIQLDRAGDDIPSGVSLLAGKRRRESGGVETVAGKRGRERSADVIGAHRAGDAGSGGDAAEDDRRFRQTTADRERGGEGPVLRKRSLPAAQQRSAAGALAGAVLKRVSSMCACG